MIRADRSWWAHDGERASFRLHDGPNMMARATQVYGTRELSGSCTHTIKNIDRRRKYMQRDFGLYELACGETTDHPVGWWVVPDMRRLPRELRCQPRTVKERDQCVALVVFRNKEGSWNGRDKKGRFKKKKKNKNRG